MASIKTTATLSQSTAKGSERARPLSSGKSRLGLAVLIAFAAIVLFYLINLASGYTDYVGPDNDDAMRLVEVRDLLNGQGWFDLMQYRLGPAPGTLMHWSRFVDLPIAALISFFGLFLSHAWRKRPRSSSGLSRSRCRFSISSAWAPADWAASARCLPPSR